ncbi:hypothetical protein RHSIM_Rhsim11G0015600 [Rhododendron simsii]|uniref:HMG box domain-containing protein n=1 Tax=Rhododendron simsii TaxID=118357 RepID=A0A834LAT1_RHOSS|nr:hypothetical protein RHSIM_Rhsim11G0015600 [Rhododendron simsii]
MCARSRLHNGPSDTTIHGYTMSPPSVVTIDMTPTPSIPTSDFAQDVEDRQAKLSGKKFPNAITIHTSHTSAATRVITICKVCRMTDEIIEEGTLKGRRAPSSFILYNSNEVIANQKDVGMKITNEIKRDIGQQWKNLSHEDRQKYKHLAKLAKKELAKQKALLPPIPKKRKLQNRISLKSIVGIVQKLSTGQRLAVELIGLGGILELRCTVLNHPLCIWLVKNFDPKTRSLTVHGRTFLLTAIHVHDCLGINAQGKFIDLEVNMSDEFSQLCENIGMTKGVVQLKELREYLEETEEVGDVFKRKFVLYILGCFLCPATKSGVSRSFINGVSDVVAMGNQNWANLTLEFLCKGIQEQRDKHLVQPNGCLFLLVVFYFDRVSPSPTVMPYVRKFPSLVHWGDIEITNILHEFDKIGGYDSQGVVVHFTLDEWTKVDEKTSGNEAGVFQISSRDAVSTNPTQASHLAYEMLSKLQEQEQPPPQMAQEMDLNQSVIVEQESSPLFTGVHTYQTSTPNELKTPDSALNKSKAIYDMPTSCFDQYNMGIDSRNERIEMNMDEHVVSPSLVSGFKSCEDSSRGTDTRKRKIQHDIAEVVGSPSPVSSFKSHAGLSRGRKKKLAFGKPVLSFCVNDNVEVNDEPRRLRQCAELKKSQFHRSPSTKDGLKKRNPPKNKNQSKTQSTIIADQHETVDNIDINVPTFRGLYVVGVMQELNPQSKIINLVAVQMTNEERSNHPDKRHFMWYLPVMRQILANPNLNDCDLKKLCDSYFGDANFIADLSSCSMIYIPTNDRGNHWFCIKVDLGIQMAYIFDSKPATRSNMFRKRLTKKVVWHTLHRPCFTVLLVDDTERPRLLMDLIVDPNNREANKVVKKFDEWKTEKAKTGFVYAGGHLVRLYTNNL